MEARQRIPADRVIDVQFRDLMTDPLRVLRQIYEHFGYPYSDELNARVEGWLAKNPRRERSGNYYDLEQFGIERSEVVQAFSAYSALYQVGQE